MGQEAIAQSEKDLSQFQGPAIATLRIEIIYGKPIAPPVEGGVQ